jgi:hypothetical protein
VSDRPTRPEDDDPDDSRPWGRDRPRRRRRRHDEDDHGDEWDDRDEGVPDPALRAIVPINTTPLAIAAGYVGLISVLCIPAPLALLLGILALRELKRKPNRDGRYRAVFAIVMGAIFTIPLVVIVIALVAKNL